MYRNESESKLFPFLRIPLRFRFLPLCWNYTRTFYLMKNDKIRKKMSFQKLFSFPNPLVSLKKVKCQ